MIGALSLSLLIMLAASIPVASVLFLLAFGVDQLYSPFPLIRGLGQIVWSSSDNSLLTAIPFFILLGEILVRSELAQRTYAALNSWAAWAPGGLVHANIGTATLFSATSGSSVATAATVATVAMPQAEKLQYDPRLFAGSIAAGGTLGIMIPPSINLIVYGFLTESSVPRLFLAGLVPGLLLAIMFMIITAILCWCNPKLGGPRQTASWRQRLYAFGELIPVAILFLTIVGTIYLGLATPTESAAFGVAMAFVTAAWRRTLTWRGICDALVGTVRITAMIMFIIIGAYVLNFALAAAGLGTKLSQFLNTLQFSPLGTLLIIVALYILLGFFIETLSLMVVTIPIIVPIVTALGYDKVWFGILMILLVEMALITPPVGLNLYVVQATRSSGSLTEVMSGAVPYVVMMLLMAVLLIAFPGLALWLPG